MAFPPTSDVLMPVPPKIIVGLDFGTTFSGFSFADRALALESGSGNSIDTTQLRAHYYWPKQTEATGEPYCKTTTSLLYSKKPEDTEWQLEPRGWGWEAAVQRRQVSQERYRQSNPADGIEYAYVTHFKLHLANEWSGKSSGDPLPQGLTTKKVISDFLAEIGKYCMEVIREGASFTMEEVQWCITVPAIWDDSAKQLMKKYMEAAGLAQPARGASNKGSPYPILIVLEPEAASIYCQNVAPSMTKGKKVLTVDAGGGTVDLVMHRKDTDEPSSGFHQVTCSDGGLCGGTYVDEAFFEFLTKKIPGYPIFAKAHPVDAHNINKAWGVQKHSFTGQDPTVVAHLDVPKQLRKLWENSAGEELVEPEPDVIVFTYQDLKSIFEPTVNKILTLIENQLADHADCKNIFMIGGFSNSEYLMSRVKDTFGARMDNIFRPVEPGAAVCKGAVLYGLNPSIFTSKISRRTYGIACAEPFRRGIDPRTKRILTDDGMPYCRGRFLIFLRLNDRVLYNETVDYHVSPISKSSRMVEVQLYSTMHMEPVYVDEPGVKLEGSFVLDLPEISTGKDRTILVALSFGKAAIEVTAKGADFDSAVARLGRPATFDFDIE